MLYSDGQKIMLNDSVQLGEDSEGVVVALIDTGEYSGQHSKEQWGYLKKGVMVEFPKYGLIHYEEAEPDLKLLKRAL